MVTVLNELSRNPGSFYHDTLSSLGHYPMCTVQVGSPGPAGGEG